MKTKKRRGRWLAAAVILAAVGAGAAYRFRDRAPEGVEVETEQATRRTVVQTVTATGRIQPVTQVAISADVSAKITQLAVKDGDWVEKGTLLLELERERYVAQVDSAEAMLRSAQSQVDASRENMIKAQKDYERSTGLFDSSLESQSQHDAARALAEAEKARHRSALDQVEQARAALKQARDDLGRTRIFAPLSGTVSKLNKEEGEIALGSQFQKDVILEISNLKGMEALIDVDENDIVFVSVGDPATIEVDALPGARLKGEVTEIANSAKLTGQGGQDQKTEFEVKVAVVEADERLRPGMTASADIVTETHADVIAVPLQSVAVRTLEQLEVGPDDRAAYTPDAEGMVEVVFVVADGKALARQVKTGIQSETHIEVLTGLAETDEVVTGSYRAISKDLKHGTPVRTKTTTATGPAIARR